MLAKRVKRICKNSFCTWLIHKLDVFFLSKQKQNQAHKLVAVIDWTAEVVSRERSWLINVANLQKNRMLCLIYSFVVSVFILHFWEEQIKKWNKINRIRSELPIEQMQKTVVMTAWVAVGLTARGLRRELEDYITVHKLGFSPSTTQARLYKIGLKTVTYKRRLKQTNMNVIIESV